MSEVVQCNYMKAALHRLNATIHSSNQKLKYDLFNEQFSYLNLNVDKFYRYLKRFTKQSRGKVNPAVKASLLKNYSIDAWNGLDNDNKKLHTLNLCKACQFMVINHTPLRPIPQLPSHVVSNSTNSTSPLSNFSQTPTSLSNSIISPSSSSISQALTPIQISSSSSQICSTPITESSSSCSAIKTPTTPFSTLTIQLPQPSERQSVRFEKETANQVLKEINETFVKAYGKDFTGIIAKVRESGLQQRLTDSERKKNVRAIEKRVKTNIEKVSQEVYFLNVRVSYNILSKADFLKPTETNKGKKSVLGCFQFYKEVYILSNCLGGPFGKKWTDVGTEWNERSEVHSSADGGPFFHEWNDKAAS